jgi:hypothetical protein
MAGFATRASFAGHTRRGATARHALTFNPDHLMGAGHGQVTILLWTVAKEVHWIGM